MIFKRKLTALTAAVLAFAVFTCFPIASLAEDSNNPDDSEGYLNTPMYQDDVTPTPKLKLASDGMFTLEPNTENDVELTIKNVTSFYAYNILVQAKATSETIPFEMTFVDKSNIKYNLQGGGRLTLKLHFKVDRNAASGTYPVELNYSYYAKDKTSFNEQDTIYIRIDNNASAPVITMTDFQSSPARIKAGEDITVFASLQNEGDFDARNLKINVTGLTSEGIGLAKGAATVFYKEYNSGFKNEQRFDFTSNKDMKTGSYPVVFKITYMDKAGTEYSTEYEYYINIVDETDESDEYAHISVISIENPTGTYGVGEEFQTKLVITNDGLKEAQNIKISAISDEDGAIVPRSASIVQYRTLGEGEQKELSFRFAPTAKSKTQNYSVGFNIEYETGEKNDEDAKIKESFEQYIGANVSNPDNDEEEEKEEDEKTSTPKIIVSKYKSTPTIVEAGQKFDLDMSFQNTHPEKTVYNIKLFITVDDETEEKGNVFSPDNASNTFYIDSIAPKQEVSHTFHMFTVPDAKARTYTIKVNFEYQDSEYNDYTTEELVGVNVKQQAKLDTSEIALPTDGYVSEPAAISFELYNTGKVTLSNLMVKVEGDFDTSTSNLFIGNLESGSTEYYEASVIPMETGEKSGKLIISYDDTNGDHVERVEDFTINVMEMEFDDSMAMPEEMPMEETGIKGFIKKHAIALGIGSAAVIAAIIAAIIIIKKIKRKKELQFDE